ncbi:MAG: PduL/EutD family phosphate acyltransferase [Veillonella sp.]|nr:PduL/EutD family phosphate acyltransferase [Veillonella sp.]
MDREQIRAIVREVIEAMFESSIPVGVSNRHVHLCQEDWDILFPNQAITKKSDLKQTGEFASEQTVTLVGPKGVIQNVRVLGPLRKQSQVEVSLTDARTLCTENGEITKSICIAAKRHIHMSPDDAKRLNVNDGDSVNVELQTPERTTVFGDVIVRAVPGFVLELHIDTDEANAANVQGTVMARIVQ